MKRPLNWLAAKSKAARQIGREVTIEQVVDGYTEVFRLLQDEAGNANMASRHLTGVPGHLKKEANRQ